MAYSTRGRDPLLDAETQAALQRRTLELLGLALIGAGGLLALVLGSYSPLDPSFLGAASGAPKNLLGYPGAYAASALTVIIGHGAWSLVAALAVWGGRFVLHQGDERAISRAIFLPIWVALAAIYAASMVPGPGWVHNFGLGGMFGDMALGLGVNLLPVPPAIGLKVLSVVLGLGMLALGLFVLGFSRGELRGTGRFLGFGLVMAYDRFARMLGRGATGAAAGMARGVSDARARVADRRAERQAERSAQRDRDRAQHFEDLSWQDDAELVDDDDIYDDDAGWEEPRPEPRGGLFSRLPSLGFGSRAQAADTRYEDEFCEDDEMDGRDDEDDATRVQKRIASAIRLRLRQDRAKLAASRGRVVPPLRRSEPEEDTPQMRREEAAELPPLRAEPPAFLRRRPLPEERAAAAPPMPDPEDEFDEDEDFAAATAERAEIPRFLAHRPRAEQPARPAAKVAVAARGDTRPSARPVSAVAAAEEYDAPPLALLSDPSSVEKHFLSEEQLQDNARMLETVLDDYGVKGDIVSVRPGPVVTMYELEPAPGLKASRVIGLADDIARSMSALSARVSTVPGRSVIGIELPNDYREVVLLRELLASREFSESKSRLPLALGKDIGGAPVIANLAKMPHLLIAGTTGSGKSVAINTMILSLLYHLSPEECRLIMIDPKMLELSVYDGIPHLLSPVVTDPKKAVVALKWVVGEMEDRYRKMSKMGVRNIEGYNSRVADALAKGEMFTRTVQTGFDDETGDPVFETEEIQPVKLPFIVVIVDEMADLMMVAGKEIEACIQRLAQMARASGIHIVMATQRPSVDVITGTIKANFPTRISFQVTSKVDSRTILGEQGAEQLLGQGDMLYMAGGAKITRVHGPFASDEEVEEVVRHLKSLGPPEYVSTVLEGPDDEAAPDIDAVLGLGGNTGGEDALYDQAVAIVIKDRKCSTSYIQRKLGIGYNKAARLVEQMEEEGLVSTANHVGKREILVPEQG